MIQSKYIQPPYLKENDVVAIAAPARKISREELAPAIQIMESWGLQVKLASNIYASHHQYAGTDEQRIQGFQELLDDEKIKAIICARGGYGSVRIIDQLDFKRFLLHPKWIVGYSDVTVFHAHLHNLGLQTLHASMPVNFKTNTPEALLSLKNTLFGLSQPYTISSHPLNRCGDASGILCGGNLSILYALSSTASDMDMHGKILFIEDLEEYLYHIDRMMMQLKRSGKLSKLAGLVVGGMNNMNDNTVPFGKSAYDIIAEAVTEYNYPLCFNFPAGHLDNNLSLRMGATVALMVKDSEVVLQYK